MPERSGAPRHQYAFAFWATLFLVFAVAATAVGYETAMHFTGVPLDGPFQLYNALRRIQAGFRPGVDFQFFHGLGVPYSHYWLYALLGGGLRGSELARELMATTLYPIVFAVVFRAFTGSWSRALALAAAAMAASFLFRMSAMLFAINGMLSLRSGLPTLIPAALLLIRSRGRRVIVVGVMLGLAMFVSTEQGLAAFLALAAVSTVASLRSTGKLGSLMEAGATLGVAIIVLITAIFSVAGPMGTMAALRYNFQLVPMDQYWFFGAPPNLFISSWRAAFRLLTGAPFVALALLLSAGATVYYCVALWRARAGDIRRRSFALGFLSLYGLISCASLLGVFTRAYVQPCWRCLLIIGLIEGTKLAERLERRPRWGELARLPTPAAAGAVALCAYAFASIGLIPAALGVSVPHIVRAHLLGHERFSALGIWPATLRDGQAAIDAHRQTDGKPPVLWSTYAGWLEARNGLFHPSFDYIIQVLGPANRKAYVAEFRATKPALVQTVRPTFTQYEGWLENNDWDLYDELLDSYRVYSVTPWSIFWERRPAPAAPAQFLGAVAVPDGAASVQFPELPEAAGGGPALVEVQVDYKIRNRFRWLPVIGASPRFLVGIEGAMSHVPISLDPFMATTRFPVIVGPGQQPILRFQTFSLLPGAALQAKRVQLFFRPLDSAAAAWMNDVVTSLR